jgi:oxygen-independent coproporphyrinogen-3 oxidase
VDAYVDACISDAQRQDAPPADTVFFGGGTPSLLPAAQLTAILDAIDRAEGAEVTVECNPDSVDAGKLAAYRAAGINRLSFGVQSFAPHVLTTLNRTHDPSNVERAVRTARDAGFDNVNVDLIYGTPGETLADWRDTLARAIDLGVEHVSAYALTIEPPTPLGQRVAAGTQLAPDDDDLADKYIVADETLAAAGFEWYEISNWAQPGRACRHNQCYWDQGDYLAVGCAAHGHRAGRRFWNVRTPERYIERIAQGASPEAGEERLDVDARPAQGDSLALRTRGGATPLHGMEGQVEELVEAGLLVRAREGRVTCTRRGRLVANDLTARLLAAADARPVGTQ